MLILLVRLLDKKDKLRNNFEEIQQMEQRANEKLIVLKIEIENILEFDNGCYKFEKNWEKFSWAVN